MILSIEIQDKKINIVQASKKGELLSILSCYSIDISNVTENDGRIINIDEVSNKIKEVLHKNNIITSKAIFVINTNSIIVRKLELPLLRKKNEIMSMIQHELEHVIAFDINQYKIIYKVKAINNSDKAYYIIYGLPLNLFNQYVELAAKLKFKQFRIEIYCNCLNKIPSYDLFSNNNFNNNDIIAFVDINKSKITFSVLNNGISDFSRISELTYTSVTDLVAEGMGDYCVNDGSKYDNFMYRYLDEISKYIRYYHSVDYESRINKLYVIGSGLNNDVIEFLTENLSNNGISVHRISNVEINKIIYNKDLNIDNYFIPILSLFHNRKDTCFCYEREYFKSINTKSKSASIVAAGTVFIFLSLMILSNIIIDDYNEKKIFISNNANVILNEKIENIKKDIINLESDIEKINTLKYSAYENDYVSSDIFREIINVVPKNTKVTSISISKNNTHLACVSSSIEEVALFLFSLRKINFVESIYIPNVEVNRELNGNYSYSVVCILKDVF